MAERSTADILTKPDAALEMIPDPAVIGDIAFAWQVDVRLVPDVFPIRRFPL